MTRFRSVGALLLPVALLLFLIPTGAAGQTTLENTLKQFSGKAVAGYVQPAADLFGANMLAGQYRSAAIPTTGFSISFDLIGMVAIVGDEQMSYTARTPEGFTPATFTTPTIFGGNGTLVTNSANPALTYRGADGVFNLKAFPFLVPQLRLGSVFGTEAAIRYIALPKIGGESLPELKLLGGGLRHNISQYLPVPLDLAVGGFYTTFTAGDIIDFTGYSLGVHASKSFAILTVYGGMAYEKSTMNLRYNSTDPNFPGQLVDIDLEGENSFRLTAGLNLSLGIFHIFGDVNVGTVTHFSGGLGFGM